MVGAECGYPTTVTQLLRDQACDVFLIPEGGEAFSMGMVFPRIVREEFLRNYSDATDRSHRIRKGIPHVARSTALGARPSTHSWGSKARRGARSFGTARMYSRPPRGSISAIPCL